MKKKSDILEKTFNFTSTRMKNYNNKKNEKIQYLIIFILIILLFLKNAFHINIPVRIILLVASVPILFGDESNMLATIFLCIPMSTGFQYKYLLFFCILRYIFKKRFKLRFRKSLFIIFLMMLWEAIHFFYGTFSFVEYLRCFAELMTLAIVVQMDLRKIDYKMILRSFMISVVGICFIILYIQLEKKGFNVQSLFMSDYNSYRFGYGNSEVLNYGLNFNSNVLGYICNLSIVASLFLYNIKNYNFIDIMLGMCSLFFGLMTLSRTFILCFGIVLILFAMGTDGKLNKKMKNILVLLITGVIVFYITIICMPEVVDNIILRFQESDVTNGRADLLIFYNNHIFSNLFFFLIGIGLQDFRGKILAIYSQPVQVCHNGLQEVWVTWGIIGIILIVGLFIDLFKDSKKYIIKRNFFQIIPFLLMIIYIQTGQLISSGVILLSFVYIYMYLGMNCYRCFK